MIENTKEEVMGQQKRRIRKKKENEKKTGQRKDFDEQYSVLFDAEMMLRNAAEILEAAEQDYVGPADWSRDLEMLALRTNELHESLLEFIEHE